MGRSHCSWCHKAGHKKTTCEEYKKTLYSWVEKNGVSYLTAEEARHFKNFKAKEAGKKTTSTRRCSFCGESGHNKKTCPSLKAVKTMYGAVNLSFRQVLEEGFRGLHQGALIGGGEYHYKNNQDVKVNSWTAMVTDVDYRNLNLGFLVAKSTPKLANRMRKSRPVKAILMSSTKGSSNSWSDGYEKENLGKELNHIRLNWDTMYHNAFRGDGDYGDLDLPAGKEYRSAHKRRKSMAWVHLFDYWRSVASDAHGYNSKTKCIHDYEIISEVSDKEGALTSRKCNEGWEWFLTAVEQKAKDDRYREDPVIDYAAKMLFEAVYFLPNKHRHTVGNIIGKNVSEYENKVLTLGDGVKLDRYDTAQKHDYVKAISEGLKREAKNV